MITIKSDSEEKGLIVENLVMFNRRGKSFLPTIAAIAVLIFGIYGYFKFTELKEKYENNDKKLAYLSKKQVSLKSQLQVVYEHRSKLEAALLKKTTDHRATKHDLAIKIKDCDANITRIKQEATNRFNALDTEHRMDKTQHEEVAADFDRLQQQYVRLSKDHQKIVAGHKEDFDKLKDAKEHESMSLRDRVDTLYKEKEKCESERRKYLGYYHSERTERLRLRESIDLLKKTLAKVKEEGSSFEQEKLNYEKKLEKAEDKIEELQKRVKEQTENLKADETSKPIGRTHEVINGSQGDHSRLLNTKLPKKPTIKPTFESPKEYNKDKILKELDEIAQKKALISRPSDKVQGIIIGKENIGPDAVKSKMEDSIKDQYEVSEPPERGDSKMDTEIKQSQAGEVNFQDLVSNKIVLDRAKVADKVGEADKRDANEVVKAIEKEVAKKGDYGNEAERILNDDDKEKLKNDRKGLMEALIRSPSKRGSVEEHDKSKLLAEASELNGARDDNKKELGTRRKRGDDGNTFLLKQQKLLARPKPKIDFEAAKGEEQENNYDISREKGMNAKYNTEEGKKYYDDVSQEKADEGAELNVERKDNEEKVGGVERGSKERVEDKASRFIGRTNMNEDKSVRLSKSIARGKIGKGDNEELNRNEDNGEDKEKQEKQARKGITNNEKEIKKNLVRNQIKPPHPNQRVHDALKLANQMPDKRRQQLQPPGKNIQQNNKAEEVEDEDNEHSKGEENEKDESVNKGKKGIQLPAPIKGPKMNKNVNESSEIDATNKAKNDDEANEDDENGDQDLDKTVALENADPEDEDRTKFERNDRET